MDGIVNIWKPVGMTSHDVVARVRRAAGTRRVGHTGTLDPMAEGVLPICVGKATHAVDFIVASRKTYRAKLRLGIVTDTQDSTGNILSEKPVLCGEAEIHKTLSGFVGACAQIPPMYSAIHHNGKRLYELARQGIEVERKPRQVTFYRVDALHIAGAEAEIEVECSKGAYIRTLCHDIGEALGCGAHMTALARTECGRFSEENAVKLDVFEENPAGYILPTETVFGDYEKITVNAEGEKRIRNGAPIYIKNGTETKYSVFSEDGTFLCISEGTRAEDRVWLKMITSFY